MGLDESTGSSPKQRDDGSVDGTFARATLEWLDLNCSAPRIPTWVQELHDPAMTALLEHALNGNIHSSLAPTSLAVLRSLPNGVEFSTPNGYKVRPPSGYLPVVNSETGELAYVSGQLPLFVDQQGRMHALTQGRIMVRHRPIPEADPLQAKVWLMRELLAEFYRIAEGGIAAHTDVDLDARRQAFLDAADGEEKGGKAALLAGTLAKHIENTLEKLDRCRLGREEPEVTRLLSQSADKAWGEVVALLPYLRLSGGPRGSIRDIDGLLGAELPEVMKTFGAGADFTVFGILSKRGDTKLEILVVGRIMHEIVRAAECADSEGPKFMGLRDRLETQIRKFTDAALARIDSEPRDGYPDYDAAFVAYRAAHRALITMLRPDDFGSDQIAVSHLNAGLDLIHGMVVLRRAMPIRASVFLAIASGARLTRAISSLNNEPALQQCHLNGNVRAFSAAYQARLRERFLDSMAGNAPSAAATLFEDASAKLTRALDEAWDQASPLIAWVRACQSFMLDTAQAVSQLEPRASGRIRPQRRVMLNQLRELMTKFHELPRQAD